MGLRQELMQALGRGEVDIFFHKDSLLVPRYAVKDFLIWVSGRASLLGAEGFVFDGEKLRPLPECIIDYSEGDPGKSIKFHMDLIEKEADFQKAHFIEFVFSE